MGKNEKTNNPEVNGLASKNKNNTAPVSRIADNSKKVADIMEILDVKSNNILNVELVSKLVQSLNLNKENKECLKSVLDLCIYTPNAEDSYIKHDATSSIKKIADFATEKSAPNDDRMKKRAVKTISYGVNSIVDNLDKKVAIVVCPTKKQEDLSFAAANSHGIVQALLEKRGKAMMRGDLEADAETTKILTALLTEIDKAAETLTAIIDDAFAKGHGSYEQIINYGRRVFEENKKDITADIKLGLSISELSEKYKISPKTLTISFNKGIKDGLLNASKKEIMSKKNEGVTLKDIIQEVGIHESLLNPSALKEKINSWVELEKKEIKVPIVKPAAEKTQEKPKVEVEKK